MAIDGVTSGSSSERRTMELKDIGKELRRIQPAWSALVSDLALVFLGLGFAAMLYYASGDGRLPGFAVAPIGLGFAGFARFLDHIVLRLQMRRLLREHVESMLKA